MRRILLFTIVVFILFAMLGTGVGISPPKFAEKQDMAVIERILALDAKGVEATVRGKDVSMCGYGPVMTMLEAVGGRSAQLLKYANSGDVQPMSEEVGYAGIVVRR